MSHLLVIGTGHAGYAFVTEYRKLQPQTTIQMFSMDAGHRYSKPMLSNAFHLGKDIDDLITVKREDAARELNVDLRDRETVTSLSVDDKKVTTTAGEYYYDTLVLALGASPRQLVIEGNGAHEVLTVNTLHDYAHFRERISNAARVLIMGAGLIGCEFANDLLKANVKPVIVDPLTRPLGALAPHQVGTDLQEALEHAGVEWRLRRAVTSIISTNSRYLAQLTDREEIEIDAVLSAAGLVPRTDLAKSAGLSTNKGICVDSFGQTSAPDVYALGDCAEFAGRLRPYIRPILAAAKSMAATVAGSPTAITFPVMPVSVKTPTHPIVVCAPEIDIDGSWVLDHGPLGPAHLFYDADRLVRGFAVSGPDATRQSAALIKRVLVPQP